MVYLLLLRLWMLLLTYLVTFLTESRIIKKIDTAQSAAHFKQPPLPFFYSFDVFAFALLTSRADMDDHTRFERLHSLTRPDILSGV